jgi:hypothetical protein
LTLDGLHGVISQKLVLFITTAVKTSNPIYCSIFRVLYPEDGGNMYLRNVSTYLSDYKQEKKTKVKKGKVVPVLN